MGGVSRGKRNGNWKGGRVIASNGYVLIRVGKDHHLADCRGYAYEHRLVAEEKVGRRLVPGELVHHVDHDKQNNVKENLKIVGVGQHRFEHRSPDSNLRKPGEPNLAIQCGCGCGSALLRYDDLGRPRSYLQGHNPHPSPVTDAIVSALSGGPRTRMEILIATGLAARTVAVCLSKLKKQGAVLNPERGVWRLA